MKQEKSDIVQYSKYKNIGMEGAPKSEEVHESTKL